MEKPLLKSTGYKKSAINIKSGNYLEFKVGGSYRLDNKEADKSIFIAFVPFGKNVLMNIGVMKFVDKPETDYNKTNTF